MISRDDKIDDDDVLTYEQECLIIEGDGDMRKGVVNELFKPVITSEWIVLESGKMIKKFKRDSTATALKRMAYMELEE